LTEPQYNTTKQKFVEKWGALDKAQDAERSYENAMQNAYRDYQAA